MFVVHSSITNQNIDIERFKSKNLHLILEIRSILCIAKLKLRLLLLFSYVHNNFTGNRNTVH